MSEASQINDPKLEQTIVNGLAKLISLVNTQSFQSQVEGFYTSGKSIVDNLSSTNYIVTITGYCDASSSVLASAVVGGDTISYNECTVQKDAQGDPDLAVVSGVLLHEISHNVGYTHPSVNPSRTTVPYWLGDTVQDDIDPASAQQPTGAASQSGGGRRKHYVIGD
jgi:hypothetical protein